MRYVVCTTCKRGYDRVMSRKCRYCHKGKNKLNKKYIGKKEVNNKGDYKK